MFTRGPLREAWGGEGRNFPQREKIAALTGGTCRPWNNRISCRTGHMVSAPPKMGEPTWSRFEWSHRATGLPAPGAGDSTTGQWLVRTNLSFRLSHKALLPTLWGRLSFPGKNQKVLYTWACELGPYFHSVVTKPFYITSPHSVTWRGCALIFPLRESKRPAWRPPPWLVPLSCHVEGCWHPTGPPGSPQWQHRPLKGAPSISAPNSEVFPQATTTSLSEALHSPQGTLYPNSPLHPSLHAIPAIPAGFPCLCQEPFPFGGLLRGSVQSFQPWPQFVLPAPRFFRGSLNPRVTPSPGRRLPSPARASGVINTLMRTRNSLQGARGGPAQEPWTSPSAPAQLSAEFHPPLAESLLNNLFGRYQKPTPGAVGSSWAQEAAAGMTSRAGRLLDWERCVHLTERRGGPESWGSGRAGPLNPRLSLKRLACNKVRDTPALFLSGNKEIPQARAQWVVVPAGSFPPPPPSLCFLGTLSCAPRATSKPTQKTCLISLPPSLLSSSMPGLSVNTQGTTVNKTRFCSHGLWPSEWTKSK